MNQRFFIRNLGILIIIQDIFIFLNISHRAVVHRYASLWNHFFNGTVWLIIILIVGILFLIAPKWLLDFLTGGNRNK